MAASKGKDTYGALLCRIAGTERAEVWIWD